jgi:hypothetical protein
MNSKDKRGLAFGEAVRILSPSNRSQIDVKPESGFGGWVDEKIKTAREAVPHLGRKKISSTTFDNSSHRQERTFSSRNKIIRKSQCHE